MKAPILNGLLADWFMKLLLPKISCDVAMSGAVIEEDVIRRAQHLNLIYSQSSTLYHIILQAPQPSNDKPRTAPRPHADGVIGFVSTNYVSQVVRQLGQLAITDNPHQRPRQLIQTTLLILLTYTWCKPQNLVDGKVESNEEKIHSVSRKRPILKKPNLAITIKRERRNSSFHA